MFFKHTSAPAGKNIILRQGNQLKSTRPTIKIDLNNDEVRSKLSKKYEKYDDIVDAYESIAQFWAYLYSITQDESLTPNSEYSDRGLCNVDRMNRHSPFHNREAAYEWCSNSLGKPTSYYKTNVDGTCSYYSTIFSKVIISCGI